MFSFLPFLSFHVAPLETARQARVELMRAFFPQTLPWRLARIQASFIELAQLPAVFARTFSTSLTDRPIAAARLDATTVAQDEGAVSVVEDRAAVVERKGEGAATVVRTPASNVKKPAARRKAKAAAAA